MGISSMKPMLHSLYSFQDEIRSVLCGSPTDSTEKQRNFEECNKSINQMISQQNVPFLVSSFGSDTHITWDTQNKLVKLINWGDAGEDPIDITEEHAMAFTNSNTVEDSCRIIELAYMTGCLIMPCFYDQFRKGREDSSPKSIFHGVPLVQSAKLFECVRLDAAGGLLIDPSGKYYEFTPSYKLLDDDDKVYIYYSVAVVKATLVHSSDAPLPPTGSGSSHFGGKRHVPRRRRNHWRTDSGSLPRRR
jgi:hypothetical protein